MKLWRRSSVLLLLLVENVAVVVAGAVFQLLVVFVDALADSVRRAEVKRCALNFQYFARRYAGVVDRQEVVGVELCLNVEHVGVGSASPAREKKPW